MTDANAAAMPAAFPPSKTQPMTMRKVVRIGLALFVAWTIFGLLSSAHFFFGYRGTALPSFLALADNVIVFYWGWALLTPVVILSARRISKNGMPRLRDVPFLVGAGCLVMLVHGVLHLTLTRLLGVDRGHVNGHTLFEYATRHGGGDLATFAVLAGGYFLFEANRRSRAREVAAAELSSRLAQADLELLRWNLHPHFLFNALNTVSTLVLKGENEDASHAITLISRYLRAGMAQRADSMVTVGEDVAMVQRYVEIETLRFGPALKLEVDADERSLAAFIPESILQPLVENAIAHGRVREEGAGPITIRATATDDRLHLLVSNPGGDGQVSLNRNTEVNDDSARFGLRYVRERLRQFYGDDASFDLSMNADVTVAALDIPLNARRVGRE